MTLEEMQKVQDIKEGNQISAYPVCPHCGADPAPVNCAFINMAGNRAVIFFCANVACRKIYSVCPIMTVMERPEPGRLIVP